jgi:hypothetical protein
VKHLRWIAFVLEVVLALGFVTAVSATSKPFPMLDWVPIYGAPPVHTRHWLRIVWQGDINHPIVPVYFLTTNRTAPKYSLTRYVRLELREYLAARKFTHSLYCSTHNISSRPPYPSSIGIDEFQGGQLRRICVLAPVDGCHYLFGLAELPQIDWSDKDTWPLSQFEAELRCPSPLTKVHDANGLPE